MAVHFVVVVGLFKYRCMKWAKCVGCMLETLSAYEILFVKHEGMVANLQYCCHR